MVTRCLLLANGGLLLPPSTPQQQQQTHLLPPSTPPPPQQQQTHLCTSFPLLRRERPLLPSSSIEFGAAAQTNPSNGLGRFLAAASACALATLVWAPPSAGSCSTLYNAVVTPTPTSGVSETHCMREEPPADIGAAPSISWLSENDQVGFPDTGSTAPESSSAKEAAARCAVTPAKLEESAAREVTNESIIQETWEVVNERFLDARHHKWSSEAWLKKKEEVLRRPVPSRMAAYGIIRSMLSELNDPYTRFITPRELKQLSKYDMTGIGLSLGEVSGENGDSSLRVVGIVLGSPAQVSGVKQGDEILSVDGVDVHGKSAFEASSLIQGLKGTLVSLKVRHEPCDATDSLLVERQMDVKTPVYYRLEHKAGDLIGYIRLREFNALAKRDLVTAMNRLKVAGASYFLLDLRDNPGGLVQAGIEIAKVFLDQGNTVIYTVGKDPALYKSISAVGPPLTTAPLMVLVNDHTASASEIVAAALHDNCRAVLVGHRTFGKGLIQSVFELSDGSGVILTVGKYVTPHHQDLDGNGIEPDFQELPGLIEAEKKIQKCAVV